MMAINDPLLGQQNHAQRERLAFIDLCLQYRGAVGRNDLMEHFGTAVASSTRDFTLYRELAPNNLILRHDSRRYYRTEGFQPLFKHDTSAAFEYLISGSGSELQDGSQASGYCEDAPELITPRQDVIAALSRSISLGYAVQINYLSLSSGNSKRIVIPHTIVNNGQRWYLRGYCRKRAEFRDFACTRITSIQTSDATIAEHEQQKADTEWNQLLTLELVPHPSHEHPAAIALDFNMQATDFGPVRQLKIRAARAGYLLQHWQVDCSHDHRLSAHQYHLWLRNIAAISSNTTYSLSNLVLAPGFTHAPFAAVDHTTRHQ